MGDHQLLVGANPLSIPHPLPSLTIQKAPAHGAVYLLIEFWILNFES